MSVRDQWVGRTAACWCTPPSIYGPGVCQNCSNNPSRTCGAGGQYAERKIYLWSPATSSPPTEPEPPQEPESEPIDLADLNRQIHLQILDCDRRLRDLDPLREEGDVGRWQGRKQGLLWVRRYIFGSEEYVPDAEGE